MSELDGGAPPPVPPPEEGAPRRRAWFRRRSPRPQPGNVAATETAAQEPAATDLPQPPAATEQRPVFRPLEAPPVPVPAATESPATDSLPADAVEVRVTRPRRRRPAASVEAGATRPLEAGVDAEAESKATAPPEQPRHVGPSPVEVNVVVPRGMARRVNSKLIQQVTRLALQREGWDTPASLDVVIVDDDEMREINATRRGIDEATDVLSFPMLELRPEAGLAEDFFVLPPEALVHLGDVVISFGRVESQADEAGHSRERELAFLTVHAVLHILGYDHDTEEKRRRMRRHEEDVLVALGLRRNGG